MNISYFMNGSCSYYKVRAIIFAIQSFVSRSSIFTERSWMIISIFVVQYTNHHYTYFIWKQGITLKNWLCLQINFRKRRADGTWFCNQRDASSSSMLLKKAIEDVLSIEEGKVAPNTVSFKT